MKIAVISDLHGNMQALERVLEDIKKENCEKILCLGDLAMAGPEPEKTVVLIKKLYDEGKLELIQGNTDEMIGNFNDEIGEKVANAFPIMGAALKNDAEVLPSELKDFLKGLPKQKELIFEGVKVLMVHGSAKKNDENVLPNLDLALVEEMFSGVDSNLIFCGHTHIPCGYQTNTKQTIVNVGSVGRPFTANPQACYVVASLENGAFQLEHKLLNYNKELAAEILAKREFDGAEKLSTILLNPEHRHM